MRSQVKLQLAATRGKVNDRPVIVVALVQELIVPPTPQVTLADVMAAVCTLL